ncbi:MAG: hypothetical protein JNJ61_02545 [Anaerolineae bacterium]|nr:hypothetical protein [Anaerolineae bacterium]
MKTQSRKPLTILLFVLITLLLTVLPLNAQDASPEFRFVVPTTADYAEQIETIIARALPTFTPENPGEVLVLDALVDEMFWRYINDGEMSYTHLLAVTRAFSSVTFGARYDNHHRLLPALFERWLAENHIDLSASIFLTFDGFTLDVQKLGDTDAFVLYVRETPFFEMSVSEDAIGSINGERYIAIEIAPGKYRVPDLPFWASDEDSQAGDFNTDGQLDVGYEFRLPLNNDDTAWVYYVGTWNGDNFEFVFGVHGYMRPQEFDPAMSWKFLNLDGDAEVELIQTQRYYDSLSCNFIRMKFYDWQQGGGLSLENEEDSFPNSFACLLRQGEQNAWDGHYDLAIGYYERALTLSEEAGDDLPYLQMRLGLAYLIEGRDQEAQSIFTNLADLENEERYNWPQDIRAAYARNPDFLAVCQAAYSQSRAIRVPERIEGTIADYTGAVSDLRSYSLWPRFEYISCDFNTLLNKTLEQMTFTTEETPVAQLEALGLVLSEPVTVDFDGDGKDEWLVWVESPDIDPLLFVPNQEASYAVSSVTFAGGRKLNYAYPGLRLPADENRYWVTILPDGKPGLVNVEYNRYTTEAYLCAQQCESDPNNECETSMTTEAADIGIWRMKDGQMSIIFHAPSCENVALADLFPNGEGTHELMAAQVIDTGSIEYEIRPATYRWDESQGTFTVYPQPTPTPTPTVTPTPTASPTGQPTPEQSVDVNSLPTYSDIGLAFSDGDFIKVLEMLNTALNDTSSYYDSALLPGFHYYRALTLEILDRPDEALLDYIAVYRDYPDTAWALMARLHLSE